MFWRKKECTIRKQLNEYRHALIEKALNQHERKIDLILKELGKEYVPEKSVTEPAKLVDKQHIYMSIWDAQAMMCSESHDTPKTKPKKKRGRPKGSKTKK